MTFGQRVRNVLNRYVLLRTLKASQNLFLRLRVRSFGAHIRTIHARHVVRGLLESGTQPSSRSPAQHRNSISWKPAKLGGLHLTKIHFLCLPKTHTWVTHKKGSGELPGMKIQGQARPRDTKPKPRTPQTLNPAGRHHGHANGHHRGCPTIYPDLRLGL